MAGKHEKILNLIDRSMNHPKLYTKDCVVHAQIFLGKGPVTLISFQRGPNSTRENSDFLCIFNNGSCGPWEVYFCTFKTQFSWQEGRKEK